MYNYQTVGESQEKVRTYMERNNSGIVYYQLEDDSGKRLVSKRYTSYDGAVNGLKFRIINDAITLSNGIKIVKYIYGTTTPNDTTDYSIQAFEISLTKR